MKQLGLCLLLLWLSIPAAFAGGPLYVAGVSGFDHATIGKPIIWRGGEIHYSTDRGGLSWLLDKSAADAFIADAFSRWTSVTTAALNIIRIGDLTEDVNGSNVIQTEWGVVLPDDIKPTSNMPLGIIYDADGTVTDALYGAGASDPTLCSTNSVFDVIDRFTNDGYIAHALVIVNGNCANQASDLPVLRYKLIRSLGRVIGMDWSQLNENVIYGNPIPKMGDYLGYPLMHPLGALCGIGYGCTFNADQLRVDDRASISRLYPITPDNLGQFSGKNLFVNSTASIHGTVRFAARNGVPTTGMQGVNVIARLIDPTTHLASREIAASSVSGFLFRGDAGNPVTGYVGITGGRLDQFGSDDVSLQGFYDLAGLELPNGMSTAQFELTTEAINPLYTDQQSVGPYPTAQIAPSGSALPAIVTISLGQDLEQDIVMNADTTLSTDRQGPDSFLQPFQVPSGGAWSASLDPYGNRDYYALRAQANRSFSFSVTAVAEHDFATIQKAQPVIGVWGPLGNEDSPAVTAPFFNTLNVGTSEIDGTFSDEGIYKLGVMDARGDGRPDFVYRARLLYADSVTPTRASVQGGTVLRIRGIGFGSNTKVAVGGLPAQILYVTAGELYVVAPPITDSIQSVQIIDSNAGAQSEMTNVLKYGAVGGKILLVAGANPPVPVGSQAPNPVRVLVTEADGTTPIPLASVRFTAPPASASFAECVSSICQLVTDANGEALAHVIVTAAGATTLQITLSDGSYVTSTVSGVTNVLDVAIPNATAWIPRNKSASIPLTAVVVSNGSVVSGKSVNFEVLSGTASLSSTTSITSASGTATTNVTLTAINSDATVSACVAPLNAPCRNFTVHPVTPNLLRIRKISGDGQIATGGQAFAPIAVHVTDSSSPSNSVTGGVVKFRVSVQRMPTPNKVAGSGDLVVTQSPEVVVLSTYEVTVNSDKDGIAFLTPFIPQNLGSLQISIHVSVEGATSAGSQDFMLYALAHLNTEAIATIPAALSLFMISEDSSSPIDQVSCAAEGCSEVPGPRQLGPESE